MQGIHIGAFPSDCYHMQTIQLSEFSGPRNEWQYAEIQCLKW